MVVVGKYTPSRFFGFCKEAASVGFIDIVLYLTSNLNILVSNSSADVHLSIPRRFPFSRRSIRLTRYNQWNEPFFVLEI